LLRPISHGIHGGSRAIYRDLSARPSANRIGEECR